MRVLRGNLGFPAHLLTDMSVFSRSPAAVQVLVCVSADEIASLATHTDGGREADYFLYVKRNTPSLQRAAFDAIQASGAGRAPDHTELDMSHGRAVRRSIWVANADGIDFPQVTRVARIRRNRYDSDGALVGKEIVHAVTSLDAKKASAGALAWRSRGIPPGKTRMPQLRS